MSAHALVTPTSEPASPVRRSRSVFLKTKNGELRGGNFTIPDGDFARFIGIPKETTQEKQGNVSGSRVLELAMRKKLDQVGRRSMTNGMAYRNMYVSWGKYANRPGNERAMVKDGLDSIQQSVGLNNASNMLYLEMQYKFQWAGKSFGVLSNLMRVRHEATKKSISEVR